MLSAVMGLVRRASGFGSEIFGFARAFDSLLVAGGIRHGG
jgi:hypothetical protein